MGLRGQQRGLAEGSAAVHEQPVISLRHIKSIDAQRILDGTGASIHLTLGCIVKAYPHVYELIEEDLMDNLRFLQVDAAIREKHHLPPRQVSDDGLTLVHVTPTNKPKVEITAESVVGGVTQGDTVALTVEIRHLRKRDYTLSPLRIHVY